MRALIFNCLRSFIGLVAEDFSIKIFSVWRILLSIKDLYVLAKRLEGSIFSLEMPKNRRFAWVCAV